MKFHSVFAAAAAVMLASAPAAAQAADAAGARDGEPVEGEEIGGGFLLPLVAALAVIAAIVLITDGDDEPTSP